MGEEAAEEGVGAHTSHDRMPWLDCFRQRRSNVRSPLDAL
jgi:hypothetical protein